MTAPAEPEQRYIIDGEYIEKLDVWLGEHGATDFQRMQIRTRLKLEPFLPQCPDWECIDHNDGSEWCCNRPPIAAPETASGAYWLITEDEFNRLVKLPDGAFNGVTIDTVAGYAEERAAIARCIRDRGIVDTSAQQRIADAPTDTLLKELKRRYRSEPIILDFVENIECELIALLREVK